MHRLYVNEDITVFWDSDKCRHAKKCVTGCPKVFDIQRKPWIDISRDENANIWKAISECPSGALGITYNYGVRVVLKEVPPMTETGSSGNAPIRIQRTDGSPITPKWIRNTKVKRSQNAWYTVCWKRLKEE